MIQLELYIQEFYDKYGLEESKRRLHRFYRAYVERNRDCLPEAAKTLIEVSDRYDIGLASSEELAAVAETCAVCIRSRNEGISYFAARAALFVAWAGDNITDDNTLYVDLDMFLYATYRAGDDRAELEKYLRNAFQLP